MPLSAIRVPASSSGQTIALPEPKAVQSSQPSAEQTGYPRHTAIDDVQALLVGTLLVAMGVVLFRHAGLLTGGTAGIAFVLHYATGWNFSWVFFVINLPFYLLAWQRMGQAFTVKTLVAVSLLAVFAEWIPRWLVLASVDTPFAAVMAGLLVGTGMLILFRHRASLGGLNVLALWLQEKRGWRAGHIQLGLDCAIVLSASAFVPWQQLVWSVLGAVAMNTTLAVNHRPGRYLAM